MDSSHPDWRVMVPHTTHILILSLPFSFISFGSRNHVFLNSLSLVPRDTGYSVRLVCLVAQSCPLLCDPVDCSPPGSSVHGILQARYRSGLLCPSPGDLPNPGIKPRSPTLQADFFTAWASKEAPVKLSTRLLNKFTCMSARLLSCVQLCNLMDCSPPGSFVRGIFQARILASVTISFSRGSFWPKDQTCVSSTGRLVLYCWANQESPFKMNESESFSVMSNSLQSHGLYGLWHSPGQNTGVGSQFLLQ